MAKRLAPGICDDCEGPTNRGDRAETCWPCKDARLKESQRRYRQDHKTEAAAYMRDYRARQGSAA